jgi:sulfopyruvate decarboxylase subunit beta
MLFDLGTLATLANERPRNLLVIVWDNECYLSIGGPATATAKSIMGIGEIARGARIRHAYTVSELAEFDCLCAEALSADDIYPIKRQGGSNLGARRAPQARRRDRVQVRLRAPRRAHGRGQHYRSVRTQ